MPIARGARSLPVITRGNVSALLCSVVFPVFRLTINWRAEPRPRISESRTAIRHLERIVLSCAMYGCSVAIGLSMAGLDVFWVCLRVMAESAEKREVIVGATSTIKSSIGTVMWVSVVDGGAIVCSRNICGLEL